MINLLEPGKYVVAVSGGVDSVVLLHMLARDKNLELIVAHFDHGIRPDSREDTEFVKKLSAKYNLPFKTKRVALGADASEAEARKNRYEFLYEVMKKSEAQAIVTAHHNDDLIETALHNVVRGTKRKGLVSMKSTDSIKRPLLSMSKSEICEYAKTHGLSWKDDPTNDDTRYTRNKLRALIKHKVTPQLRKDIDTLLTKIKTDNQAIEEMVDEYLANQPTGSLDRGELEKLDNEIGSEIIAAWLRKNNVTFDAKTISRILKGNQNLRTGAQIDLQNNAYCQLTRDKIVLKSR